MANGVISGILPYNAIPVLRGFSELLHRILFEKQMDGQFLPL